MDPWDRLTSLRHIGRALGRGIACALVLPLVPALLFQLPLSSALALIGSGLLIEYGAAPVGIALGLPPAYVFWVLVCTETGIFLCLFDIFDTLGHTWEPATRLLERTKELVHQSAAAERYGILALIPSEILLGVYINAPAAWVLGWREEYALLLTMAAYCLALLVTLFLTIGFFQTYLPGGIPV